MRELLWFILVGPKCHHKHQQLLTSVLVRPRQRAVTDTCREGSVKTETEEERWGHKPRNASLLHQKLEKAGRILPWSPRQGALLKLGFSISFRGQNKFLVF